jgi:cobalt-zinc-cadmium efflux system outer membrane protein
MYPTESDVTSVMVGIGFPIYDRNQGGIARSEAAVVRSRFEIERLEIDLQQRAATAYREYSNARHQARRYSARILPKARKSIEWVRRGYSEGQVRYLELLVAQQKYVEVNLSYLLTIRKLRESATVIQSQLLIPGLHGHGGRLGR